MDRPDARVDRPAICVIIAAYNEQAFIAQTVSAVLGSGVVQEVIVVDDGSTDATRMVLDVFEERIRVIAHSLNRGKGAALVTGLSATNAEIVIFCDAHLQGLRGDHLLSLAQPLVCGAADAVLGVGVAEGDARVSPGLTPMAILTGQRAYRRVDLLPWLDDFEGCGYGVETFLYAKYARSVTAVVALPGLVHLTKIDTTSLRLAMRMYLREVLEILRTVTRIGWSRLATPTRWDTESY